MNVFFLTLGLFLLAFTGLAAGLLLGRRGVRGGCSSARAAGHDCHCKSASRRKS
jgi:hypothetical protein